ncbi:MAG: adenylate/guanylate cyclase domain-containing protein, partial [Myxococcota bacterium]
LGSAGVFYATMAYMLGLVMVYLVSRLRFLYTALTGVSSLILGAWVVVITTDDAFATLSVAMFGVATNIVGLFGSYRMEYSARENYIHLRTIEEERARTESLLLNIFPSEIALRLKSEQGEIADSFASVSVLFADIVGFTPLAQRLPPAEVVQLLNRLFTKFDALTVKYGVEKIKTIGDAYMAAAGLPVPRDDHAVVLARMALEMHKVMRLECIELPVNLELRIGLHSGEVVAGVIGQRRFCYDLWGDTVNTAARMESHSLPGKIQITADTRALLEDKFTVEERGSIEVKGKGTMKTHWLLEECVLNDSEAPTSEH